MSFYDWVNSAVDVVTETGEKVYAEAAEKVGDVKEYFAGDDAAVEEERDAIPGTNGASGSAGFNWTAAGVVVGALTLAAKFIK